MHWFIDILFLVGAILSGLAVGGVCAVGLIVWFGGLPRKASK